MWALRSARRARTVLADVPVGVAGAAGPSRLRDSCSSPGQDIGRRPFSALRSGRRSNTQCTTSFMCVRWASSEQEVTYVTEVERSQALLLESARKKAEEYKAALNETGENMSVEDQKSRSKLLKQLAPLAEAYGRYCDIRKAISDLQGSEVDPDPDMQEMFEAEKEGLTAEFDELILDTLPKVLLPPLNDAPLATMMTITAGIGGGEAARFAEELSKMYTKHGESKGWKVEVLTAVEGPMAKGSGGNGFREMVLKFSPAEWAEEGTECFGDLMWEKGTHRVQRVPPGATVDKMHSSTVNVSVSPIYVDTVEEPLVDPKDVKEDVMRARGPGGQHVNKTESAIRLIHGPTGITVSMQDSRSQHQNRLWAWDVLRARLSERRRALEQEERNARRISSIKGSFRGDKIRTYNYPQDRVTDHRLGWSTTGLEDVMSGEGFGKVVEAMKADLTARRLEVLLEGGEDIME